MKAKLIVANCFFRFMHFIALNFEAFVYNILIAPLNLCLLLNFFKRKLKARFTLKLSEAQKLVCFIEMELCEAHNMCPVQPRAAEKNFTLCAHYDCNFLPPGVLHFPGT